MKQQDRQSKEGQQDGERERRLFDDLRVLAAALRDSMARNVDLAETLDEARRESQHPEAPVEPLSRSDLGAFLDAKRGAQQPEAAPPDYSRVQTTDGLGNTRTYSTAHPEADARDAGRLLQRIAERIGPLGHSGRAPLAHPEGCFWCNWLRDYAAMQQPSKGDPT